jgi:hypothetical protein
MSAPPEIRIWRFAAAPKELKSLFKLKGGREPAWLALVSRALRGTDVERFLQERTKALPAVEPHETFAKDVVYCGGVLQKDKHEALSSTVESRGLVASR